MRDKDNGRRKTAAATTRMINLGFERNPIRCINEDKREHGRYGNLDQKKVGRRI